MYGQGLGPLKEEWQRLRTCAGPGEDGESVKRAEVGTESADSTAWGVSQASSCQDQTIPSASLCLTSLYDEQTLARSRQGLSGLLGDSGLPLPPPETTVP